MNRWRMLIALLVVVLFASPLLADGLKSEDDAKALATKALGHFAKEEFEPGYKMLIPYWPLPESEIMTLIYQTQSQWEIVRSRFGKSVGTELVQTERIGTSFMRLRYIQKFDRHALRWTFAFYRPKGEWVINEVSFDDDVDTLYRVSE